MTFRIGLLAAIDRIRSVTGPTGLDVRTNQLTIRTRTWAGGRPGMPGSLPHLYASPLRVLAPIASTLPTAIALVNELRAAYIAHVVDTKLHSRADTTHVITAPVAIDLASAEALANNMKAVWTLHIADTTVHWNADISSVVADPTAVDLASLLVLVNSERVAWNAHLALSAASDVDLVLPARYKISQLAQREIAASGGEYENGDIIVEHITPSNGAGVGYTPQQLKPRITTNDVEVIYVINGEHPGEYALRELRTFRPFSFDLVLKRRETTP